MLSKQCYFRLGNAIIYGKVVNFLVANIRFVLSFNVPLSKHRYTPPEIVQPYSTVSRYYFKPNWIKFKIEIIVYKISSVTTKKNNTPYVRSSFVSILTSCLLSTISNVRILAIIFSTIKQFSCGNKHKSTKRTSRRPLWFDCKNHFSRDDYTVSVFTVELPKFRGTLRRNLSVSWFINNFVISKLH